MLFPKVYDFAPGSTYKVFSTIYTQIVMSHLNLLELTKKKKEKTFSTFNLSSILVTHCPQILSYTDSSVMDRQIDKPGYCETCCYIQNIFICGSPGKESEAVQILNITWIDGAGWCNHLCKNVSVNENVH